MYNSRQSQRWTETDARAAFSEFSAMGGSAAEFARRKGISVQKLAYWKKRVRDAETTRFVAVKLPRSTVAGPPAATGSEWIEIVAAGVVVRVREELEIEHVAELVEAIAPCLDSVVRTHTVVERCRCTVPRTCRDVVPI